MVGRVVNQARHFHCWDPAQGHGHHRCLCSGFLAVVREGIPPLKNDEYLDGYRRGVGLMLTTMTTMTKVDSLTHDGPCVLKNDDADGTTTEEEEDDEEDNDEEGIVDGGVVGNAVAAGDDSILVPSPFCLCCLDLIVDAHEDSREDIHEEEEEDAREKHSHRGVKESRSKQGSDRPIDRCRMFEGVSQLGLHVVLATPSLHGLDVDLSLAVEEEVELGDEHHLGCQPSVHHDHMMVVTLLLKAVDLVGDPRRYHLV